MLSQMSTIDAPVAQQLGQLEVLYRCEPTAIQPFVEVRRWSTSDGRHIELLAEYGYVEGNDLDTVTVALPFWWGPGEILEWLGVQGLA